MQKQVQTYDQVFEARLSESKESVRTRGRIWPNRVRRNRPASRTRVRGVNRDGQSIPTASHQDTLAYFAETNNSYILPGLGPRHHFFAHDALRDVMHENKK